MQTIFSGYGQALQTSPTVRGMPYINIMLYFLIDFHIYYIIDVGCLVLCMCLSITWNVLINF